VAARDPCPERLRELRAAPVEAADAKPTAERQGAWICSARAVRREIYSAAALVYRRR
jgi:hypothetical protein